MPAVAAILIWIYYAGLITTFIVLIREVPSHLAFWRWILLVPIDGFLSSIWPIYWVIIKPLFG